MNRLQTLIARLRLRLRRPRLALESAPQEERPVSRKGEKPSLAKLSRHSVMAAYCRHYKPGGAILELGCGEGWLHEALTPSCFARYVGVDRSEAAIKRASANEDAKSTFLVEDLNYYIPRERFDVIIFGDCLRTLAAPASALARYARYLKPRGLFLVALAREHDQVWNALDTVYRDLDSVQMTFAPGIEWVCKGYSTQPLPSPDNTRRHSDRDTRTS